MATEKINARDMVFQVSDGAVSPTWYSIGGMNNFKVNYGENEETVDTTDFNSQGNYEFEYMQRGAKIDLEGFFMADVSTGARDPGQARLEALATLTGTSSKGDIRFRYPGATTWKVWKAGVSIGEQGGGNNDKKSFQASVGRSGASTTAPVS